MKTNPYDLANVEFTPDRESNFANEVFLKNFQKNKYKLNQNTKRNSDKENVDERVFDYLQKLKADTEKLLNDAKSSELEKYPDNNVCFLM